MTVGQMSFAETLAAAIESRSTSHRQLARRLAGVPEGATNLTAKQMNEADKWERTIRRYLDGTVRSPRVAHRVRLAAALDVSLSALLPEAMDPVGEALDDDEEDRQTPEDDPPPARDP